MHCQSTGHGPRGLIRAASSAQSHQSDSRAVERRLLLVQSDLNGSIVVGYMKVSLSICDHLSLNKVARNDGCNRASSPWRCTGKNAGVLARGVKDRVLERMAWRMKSKEHVPEVVGTTPNLCK